MGLPKDFVTIRALSVQISHKGSLYNDDNAMRLPKDIVAIRALSVQIGHKESLHNDDNAMGLPKDVVAIRALSVQIGHKESLHNDDKVFNCRADSLLLSFCSFDFYRALSPGMQSVKEFGSVFTILSLEPLVSHNTSIPTFLVRFLVDSSNSAASRIHDELSLNDLHSCDQRMCVCVCVCVRARVCVCVPVCVCVCVCVCVPKVL
jgi:hypothetical protein